MLQFSKTSYAILLFTILCHTSDAALCATGVGLGIGGLIGAGGWGHFAERGSIWREWILTDVVRHDAELKGVLGYQPADEGTSLGPCKLLTNDPWDLIIQPNDQNQRPVRIPWTSLQVHQERMLNGRMQNQKDGEDNTTIEIADVSQTSWRKHTKLADAIKGINPGYFRDSWNRHMGLRGDAEQVFYTLKLDLNGLMAEKESASYLYDRLRHMATFGRGGACALPLSGITALRTELLPRTCFALGTLADHAKSRCRRQNLCQPQHVLATGNNRTTTIP